jgi:N-glycosylase/DNA lyase
MRTKSFISEVKAIENSQANYALKERLSQFRSFKKKSTTEWFSELCFCILAANSKALTSIAIQQDLEATGFLALSKEDIIKNIIKNKHRFHNNKTKYILESRKHHDIKHKLSDMKKKMSQEEIREWLVKNIKGIGYKEASHFLRNTGHEDFAILDRHIINTMVEHGFIKRPKTLNRKTYLEIEKTFKSLAKKCNMSPAKLDLILWFSKTKQILK